jgi:uncharacterized membrane protein
MRRFGVALLAVVVVLGVLDAAWLATMVPAVYRPQLGSLLADRPAWAAAAGFYLLYAVGLVVLVILPTLDRPASGDAGRVAGRSIRAAAWRGGMLGLVAYGTYDLTNLATLRDWPLVLTALDMAWGTALTATAAAVPAWVVRRLA